MGKYDDRTDVAAVESVAPWLKDAHFENAHIVDNGYIFWVDGTWVDGTWVDGTWVDGTWVDGVWVDGTWKGGLWKGGTWKFGLWKDGTWEGGIWEDGTWKGVTWEGGTWKGGHRIIGFCKWAVYYNSKSGFIKIGCHQKTISEWDAWFLSSEIYETRRGTQEFEMIRRSYLLAKYAIELENTSVFSMKTGDNTNV